MTKKNLTPAARSYLLKLVAAVVLLELAGLLLCWWL